MFENFMNSSENSDLININCFILFRCSYFVVLRSAQQQKRWPQHLLLCAVLILISFFLGGGVALQFIVGPMYRQLKLIICWKFNSMINNYIVPFLHVFNWEVK